MKDVKRKGSRMGLAALLCAMSFVAQAGEPDAGRRVKLWPGPGAGHDGRPVVVFYVMDGERLAPLANALCATISGGKGATAACAVVAVETPERVERLTPTRTHYGRDGRTLDKPMGGGARETATWLLDKVKPEVEARWRHVPLRHVLMGHSLGGLFTLWMMTEHPRAFDAWVAADPSLWWDRGVLTRSLEKADHPGSVDFIYVGFGTALAGRQTTARRNVAHVPAFEAALKPWVRRDGFVDTYAGETHGTIVVPVFHEAVKRLLGAYPDR